MPTRHALRIPRRLLVALMVLSGPVTVPAQDFPRLKPGLWEISMKSAQREGAAPRLTTLCLDDTVQQAMYRMSTGMMTGMCSKYEIKVAGGKVTTDAVCDLGGTKMQSRAVMTLTGNTAYRTEAHATFDPPMGGMRESSTIIEGRHVGACKQGQQPGDMTLPGGKSLNIRQLLGQGKS
jgi:hypothetical protein